MSNTKFTNGEWAVSIQGLHDFKYIAVMVPNGGFEVTNIPDAEANAHLIASAPDMYAMLEDSRTMLRAFYANTGSMGAIAQVRFIDELLKKARGE
jgi:hypothetical protein